MSMQDFFTRQKANDGKKEFLYYPDGTASAHWIIIRGVDSDNFRDAETAAKRKLIEISQIEDEQERNEAYKNQEVSCIASLIAGWSFDEELTTENVIKLLKEAPQIAEMVNRYAARRGDFFAKK